MFNNFFFENPFVREIMWKIIVEPDRPQMAIWRRHVACWISKTTNTHSEYVILIASQSQQWLHEGTSVLRCNLHCLSCSQRLHNLHTYKADPFVLPHISAETLLDEF
jgi:hypothetical protein